MQQRKCYEAHESARYYLATDSPVPGDRHLNAPAIAVEYKIPLMTVYDRQQYRGWPGLGWRKLSPTTKTFRNAGGWEQEEQVFLESQVKQALQPGPKDVLRISKAEIFKEFSRKVVRGWERKGLLKFDRTKSPTTGKQERTCLRADYEALKKSLKLLCTKPPNEITEGGERYLRLDVVAATLRVSISTIRLWEKCNGTCPLGRAWVPYKKHGVRYYRQAETHLIQARMMRCCKAGIFRYDDGVYLTPKAIRRDEELHCGLDAIAYLFGRGLVTRRPNARCGRKGTGLSPWIYRRADLVQNGRLALERLDFDGTYPDGRVNLTRAAAASGLTRVQLKGLIKMGLLPSVKQKPPQGIRGDHQHTVLPRDVRDLKERLDAHARRERPSDDWWTRAEIAAFLGIKDEDITASIALRRLLGDLEQDDPSAVHRSELPIRCGLGWQRLPLYDKTRTIPYVRGELILESPTVAGPVAMPSAPSRTSSGATPAQRERLPKPDDHGVYDLRNHETAQEHLETARKQLEVLNHIKDRFQPAGPIDKPTDKTTILSLGDNLYEIGDHPPVEVTARENTILQHFLGRPSKSKTGWTTISWKALTSKIGGEATRVLASLQEKYEGIFKPALRIRSDKGSGGYSVRIKAANP